MDEHFTHNPRKLLREVSAVTRLRDIREWADLKEAIAPHWWESVLRAMLFISGLGMMATVFELAPQDPPLLHGFIVTWAALYVITGIACVEFLMAKFRALRRMTELLSESLDGPETPVAPGGGKAEAPPG